jgi:sporulation protein YunB
MRIRKEQKSKKRRLRLKCLLLAAVLIAALLGTDAQLRPAIAAAAGSQANLYATQAIQEAVFQEMEGLELEYGDLVRLTYSDQGSVTSLQTDMLAMSRLQSAVTTSVIESILRFSSQQVTLPAGSLTGNPFFSGRGPEVEIRLIPAGFVQTQMKNVFESAGINQPPNSPKCPAGHPGGAAWIRHRKPGGYRYLSGGNGDRGAGAGGLHLGLRRHRPPGGDDSGLRSGGGLAGRQSLRNFSKPRLYYHANYGKII